VYDNLVKTVNDHVALLRRYLALKKRVLKVAGVDMTSPKPIEDAMAIFEQLLKELEQLLKS
jgi:oligoendopeptidase F